jgi:hypothetical protein
MTTCTECSEIRHRRHRQGPVPGAAYLILALLFMLLGGCAAPKPQGMEGGLVHSDEVGKIFENNTVLPDHVYYYAGPENEPEAIIGIHASFTLQAQYWHQIALTQEQLQAWNRRIDNEHRIRFVYKGARIMTPDGRQAGVWYSKFENTASCFPDPKTVILYTPDPPPVRGGVRPGFPYLEF